MKKDWTIERWVAFIMGVVLLFLFLGRFYWGAMLNAWPQVEGRVLQSSIKSHGWYFETVIEYEYEVNRHKYFSTHLLNSTGGHYEISRDQAFNIISNYSPNTRVSVFYNPQDPQRATLSLSFGKSPFEENMNFLIFIFILGLFFFASGVLWNAAGRGSDVGAGKGGINLIARDLYPKRKEKK